MSVTREIRGENLLTISRSVDNATEELMQSVLDEEFAGCTVLAIAHRLDAVLDYDKVVILNHGRICEIGKPRALLDLTGSRFKAMYEATSSTLKSTLTYQYRALLSLREQMLNVLVTTLRRMIQRRLTAVVYQ